MCKDGDGEILSAVFELKGVVSGIKDKQSDIHKAVTDNRVAAQKDIKDLSVDITKFKIKVYGIGAVFGSISGFLSRYIPS